MPSKQFCSHNCEPCGAIQSVQYCSLRGVLLAAQCANLHPIPSIILLTLRGNGVGWTCLRLQSCVAMEWVGLASDYENVQTASTYGPTHATHLDCHTTHSQPNLNATNQQTVAESVACTHCVQGPAKFCHVNSQWFLDSVFKPKGVLAHDHEPSRSRKKKHFGVLRRVTCAFPF